MLTREGRSLLPAAPVECEILECPNIMSDIVISCPTMEPERRGAGLSSALVLAKKLISVFAARKLYSQLESGFGEKNHWNTRYRTASGSERIINSTIEALFLSPAKAA